MESRDPEAEEESEARVVNAGDPTPFPGRGVERSETGMAQVNGYV